MKSYQNTLTTATSTSFIEIGTYSGAVLDFTAKRPKVKVGGQEVVMSKGTISVRTPHEVTACGDNSGCTVGTVTESMKIDFNIVSLDALDVLKAELDRIFALTKVSLVHGVLPAPYSSFTEE